MPDKWDGAVWSYFWQMEWWCLCVRVTFEQRPEWVDSKPGRPLRMSGESQGVPMLLRPISFRVCPGQRSNEEEAPGFLWWMSWRLGCQGLLWVSPKSFLLCITNKSCRSPPHPEEWGRPISICICVHSLCAILEFCYSILLSRSSQISSYYLLPTLLLDP